MHNFGKFWQIFQKLVQIFGKFCKILKNAATNDAKTQKYEIFRCLTSLYGVKKAW